MPSKIAERVNGFSKKVTSALPSMTGGFLTNKWFLYLVLFSAIFDIFYFYKKNDMQAILIFLVIGFLVSFFSKNMVVILILAIVLTHLIRFGKQATEGFEDEEEEPEAFEGEEEEELEGFEGDEEEEEGFEGEEEEELEGFEEDEEEVDGFAEIAKTAGVVEQMQNSTPPLDESTQQLLDTQKQLMKNMEGLKPMLEKAHGFLSGSKTEKFTDYASAYKS
jgi:hypothetical protein